MPCGCDERADDIIFCQPGRPLVALNRFLQRRFLTLIPMALLSRNGALPLTMHIGDREYGLLVHRMERMNGHYLKKTPVVLRHPATAAMLIELSSAYWDREPDGQPGAPLLRDRIRKEHERRAERLADLVDFDVPQDGVPPDLKGNGYELVDWIRGATKLEYGFIIRALDGVRTRVLLPPNGWWIPSGPHSSMYDSDDPVVATGSPLETNPNCEEARERLIAAGYRSEDLSYFSRPVRDMATRYGVHIVGCGQWPERYYVERKRGSDRWATKHTGGPMHLTLHHLADHFTHVRSIERVR